MDKAFDNFKTVEPGRKRPSTDTAPDTALEVQPDQVKRQKLSASLQSDGDETNIGLKQPPRRLPMSLKKDETPDPSTHSRPLQKDDEGVEIPVKKFHAPAQGRETRSQALRGTVDLVNDGEQNPASSPNLKDVSTHLQKCSDPKWSKPLIYPRQGKKKAEVDSYDLERLRDGEFLNDNLIGFYLRFLEHHLERTTPELAKRVYFFNSYFFATLTNMTKGKRGINYEGVQKWTRNVDLFSHDYVIVPINESAHWYLAIICNLTSLEQKNEDTIELEPVPESVVSQTLAHRAEIPETPPTDAVLSGKEIAASSREEKTRESFASMTLSEVVPNSQPTERSDDEWPEKEENPTSSPAKFSPHPREPSTEMKGTKSLEKKESTQKGKRQKRKGHVLSIDQPTIITFDSLGATRFPAVKALRSYLLEEAASKRSLDLDPKDIKSMTAKEIPLQPNFWDCGLYLLAYLEKFVQDPDQFARKLLQKEMSAEKDWPTLTSGLLRRRLRDFLFELREEQDGAKYEKILADVVPISYLLGPPQEPEVIPDSMPDPTEKILENAAEISDSAPDLTQVQEQPTTPEDKRIKNGSKIDAEGGTLEKSATGAPEVEAMVHRPTDDRDIVEVEHEPPATPQYKVVESPDKGAGATLSYNGHTTRSSPRVTRRTKPQETPSPKTTGRLQTTEDTRWMDELHSYITNDTPETRESSRVKVEIQVPSTPPSASTSDIVAETPRHNLRQAKSRKDDH
jgi:sentrin-specific protease 7